MLLTILSFLAMAPTQTQGTLASTWTYCNCRWDEWKAWSDCTSTCFGRQVRERSVWLTQNPGCMVFTDCASNDEGFEYRGCNEVCQNEGLASGISWRPCTCNAGYYNTCCEERVNCGQPDSITNGYLTVDHTYYAGTATYTCDIYYNITTENRTRVCQDNFLWSGSQPSCVFVNHCASGPCKNGATCIDLLDNYRCVCKDGWDGVLCQNDIQPPAMEGCNGDIHVNATHLYVSVNWTAPTFIDPFGNDIDIVTNYQEPTFVYPWGDFAVQYVATKTNNGLQTVCRFNVHVRPTPCPELNVPANGARICNGWKTDYGRYCMLTCLQNYTISPLYKFQNWYVCGASGTWIAPNPMPDCEIKVVTLADAIYYEPDYTQYTYQSSCNDPVSLKYLQNLYIKQLNHTDRFSDVCTKFANECLPDNVDVKC